MSVWSREASWRSDSRVALGEGTGFPHDKEHFRLGGGRIQSQGCPGLVISNVEAIQFGSTPVTHKGSAPQGGHVEADTGVEDGKMTRPKSATTALAQETWEWNHWIFYRPDLESAKVSK